MSFFATGMGKLWLNSMPHFILVNVEGSFSFSLEEKASHTTWLSLAYYLVTLETQLLMVVDILWIVMFPRWTCMKVMNLTNGGAGGGPAGAMAPPNF